MQKANFAFLFSGGLKKKADPLINFPLLTKSVTWDTVCRGSVVRAPKRGRCDSDESLSGGVSELECRVMWCDIE